eukprot:6064433-Heterocapsa_arctica.AAC.1
MAAAASAASARHKAGQKNTVAAPDFAPNLTYGQGYWLAGSMFSNVFRSSSCYSCLNRKLDKGP